MGQTTKLEQVEVASLRPYERNAKLHPRDQIEKLKRSIDKAVPLSRHGPTIYLRDERSACNDGTRGGGDL